MTMKKRADLFATVGEWTDDFGIKRKRKVRCGVVMHDPCSGRESIRIEALPVTPDWSGWLSVAKVSHEHLNATEHVQPPPDVSGETPGDINAEEQEK